MSILVLTEKNSQVTALGKFIDLKRSGRASKGNYNNDEIIVFPLSGHIIDIIPITTRQDDIEKLPNLPSETSLMKKGIIEAEEWDNPATKKAKENNKKIYFAFKKLLETINIDRIILATDLDYEGCGIAVEILQEFKLMDHKINFMNIGNTVPKKLKEEFDLAISGKDAVDWRAWANVSFVRGEINHCSGIDISHYLMKSTDSMTTFGSQQTRGLKLLVDRYFEHTNFDLSKHYRIRAKTPVGIFTVDLDKDRLKEKDYVYGVFESIQHLDDMTVTKVDVKKSLKKSPNWYDGSDIGTELAEQLDKSVEELVSKDGGLLQRMYEQEKMTYPRGEALGKMPISQFEEQAEIAKAIAGHYGASRLNPELRKDYLWRDDTVEGSAGEMVNHTPCTIASSEINLDTLSKDEKAVIDMSAKMLLSCFYPDNKVKTVTLICEADGVQLEHSSSIDVDLGWKELYGKEKRTSSIPDGTMEGDRIIIESMKFEEYVKEPPRLFTETSFVREMKKRKIGAESTFGTHVKNILDPKRGYAEVKNRKLIPTEKGIKFIELVPDSVINILSLFEEEVFKDLECGKMSLEQALKGRHKIIKQSFEKMKEAINDNPSLMEIIKSGSKKPEILVGTCPRCEGDVVDRGGNSKAYTCVNRKGKMIDGSWVSDGSCSFQMWKVCDTPSMKYSIGIKEAKTLMEGEEVEIEVHWKQSDKKVKNTSKLDMDGEGEAKIEFIFNK